jgi:hypothetical protein
LLEFHFSHGTWWLSFGYCRKCFLKIIHPSFQPWAIIPIGPANPYCIKAKASSITVHCKYFYVQLGTLELEGQFLCTVQICCCFVSCVHEGYIRVICKVRKTQHQNPEFGHTQGEIQKKPAKKYISIQPGVKLRKPSFFFWVVNWVSSCLSFSLSASIAATYIFSAPTVQLL